MDANDERAPEPPDSAGLRAPQLADSQPNSLLVSSGLSPDETDVESRPNVAELTMPETTMPETTDFETKDFETTDFETTMPEPTQLASAEPHGDGERPVVDLTSFRGPLVDAGQHEYEDQLAFSASVAGPRASSSPLPATDGSFPSGPSPVSRPTGDVPSVGAVAGERVGELADAVTSGSIPALASASVLDLTDAHEPIASVGEPAVDADPVHHPVDEPANGTPGNETPANNPRSADIAPTDDEDHGLVGDFLGAVSSLAISRRKKIGAVLLVGWIALFVFTMTVVRGRVERELEESSRKVLILNSQPGLKVDASGLTVSISGFVESPEDRERAAELVRSRFGVRAVRNNLVIDAAKVASVQAEDVSNVPGATDPNGSSGSSASSAPTRPPSMPVRGPSVDVVIKPGADGSVGSVEVRGTVPTSAAKDALFARVSNVVPVERIASNVQIPTTVTEQPDMQAYRRLGSFLEIVAKTKTPDVRISFNEGNLTMSGSVSDLNDLALIRAEARNLVGSKTFADTMTVVSPAESTPSADSTVGADGSSTTSAPDGSGATTPTIAPVQIEGVGRTDTPAAKTAQVAVDAVIAGKVIAFEKNKALLTSDGRKLLNELATALLASSDKTVKYEISGHTDDKGSESANLDLSTRRAEAVREALIAKGVDASQLIAKGYGESDPVATNDTESGRSQNRRIQVRAAS